MPRIPYLPDADPENGEFADLIQAIRNKRGGQLLHIDRILMHSQPLIKGWAAYLGAVRNDLEVDARYRELAILAVSARNNTAYEWHHHKAPFLKAGGNDHQYQALEQPLNARDNSKLFDPVERAVITLALEMTDQPQASEDTVHAARAALGSDKQVVELVALIAAYNMVSRVINTLDIEIE